MEKKKLPNVCKPVYLASRCARRMSILTVVGERRTVAKMLLTNSDFFTLNRLNVTRKRIVFRRRKISRRDFFRGDSQGEFYVNVYFRYELEFNASFLYRKDRVR